MTYNYPHSPEYLARRAERRRKLGDLRAKLTWTDAQFLAKRDAEYIAEQRRLMPLLIIDLERQTIEDNDPEDFIRRYGTDEG